MRAPEIAAELRQTLAASANPDTAWQQPLGAAAYHGPIGALVQALEPETEADPVAILLQIMVLLGNIIGRTAHFTVGADKHYLNLFAAIVGDTSSARKGVSRGQALRVFAMLDPDYVKACVTNGLSSGEGLIWEVRDQIEKQEPLKEKGRIVGYQTVIEDHGVADKRRTIFETELASTFKVMSREGNTLSAIVRQAWDGQDLRAITKSSSARSTAPHVSLVGHITTDELLRLLTATDAANGFGNRFLWARVRRSKLLPDGGAAVDLSTHAAALREVIAHAKEGRELRRDGEATALWHHVYGRLSAGRPGMAGAMTARAEALVMRLAGLYALGDLSYFVTADHLRAGLALWRYCSESADYLFGNRLGHPVADAIWMALRNAHPAALTRTAINGIFKGNRAKKELDLALALLQSNAMAEMEEDGSGAGRPVERWFFTPRPNEINELNEIWGDDLTSFNSSPGGSGIGGADGNR